MTSGRHSLSAGVLDPLADTRWDDAVAGFPDATIFHSRAWARVLQRTYGYEPAYLRIGEPEEPRALLPLLGVHSWLTGRRGVALPFTDHCPPLLSDAGDFARLVQAAIGCGRNRRWRTLELRGAPRGESLYPAFSDTVPPPAEPPAAPRPASTAFYRHHLRLEPDPAALFLRLDSAHRRAVRKAESSPLAVSVETSLPAMREFYGLMCLTRRRHGVPPQPWSFFRHISEEIIQPGRGCLFLARVTSAAQAGPVPGNEAPPAGGPPVAGAVFLHSGPTTHYKFGASDESWQGLRPNNLVMWRAIEWHARRAFQVLDFGRTSLDNAGLRKFKLGWSAEETPLAYDRIDLATGRNLVVPDRASGWHNRVFRTLPVPLNRLAGRLLYRHIG